MPIKIPSNLPAFDVLKKEGVMVMDNFHATRQDIRPLRLGLLNLMPKKIQTENQFARVIGATPLQIELSLIKKTTHDTKNTAASHMEAFYRSFKDIRESGEKFDGLIITGAPIEHLKYETVTYWDELIKIFEWTRTNVHSVFGVCWGGMAMLYHLYGIKKYDLNEKAFGCFRHDNIAPGSPYLRGFSDDFIIPVSRWTELKQADLNKHAQLRTLLASSEVGPCLIEDQKNNALFILNHFEYDSDTLKQEYDRDLEEGKEIFFPKDYFPENDPSISPKNRWRSHAHLLYGNWINEIYQKTPYDLNAIGA